MRNAYTHGAECPHVWYELSGRCAGCDKSALNCIRDLQTWLADANKRIEFLLVQHRDFQDSIDALQKRLADEGRT